VSAPTAPIVAGALAFVLALADCGTPAEPVVGGVPSTVAPSASVAAASASSAGSSAPIIAASASVVASAPPLASSFPPVSHASGPGDGPIFWIPDAPECKGVPATPPKRGIPVIVDSETDTSSPRLPFAVVFRILRNQRSELEKCYFDSPIGKTCHDVAVHVAFTVDRNGTVSKSEGQPAEGGLGACVAGVVAGLTFPEPEGGSVSFTMPIRFLR
jgi:hypothetical protein